MNLNLNWNEVRGIFLGCGVIAAMFILSAMFPPKIVLQHNATQKYLTESGLPPQFVIMAFDGSKSLEMWDKTLTFARDMKQDGIPVHFTYFLSGVYLLDENTKNIYTPPNMPPGSSLIGFASKPEGIAKRVEFINLALKEGHEIGSHAGGHFDGTNWTYDDWRKELASFDTMLFHVGENNPSIATSSIAMTKQQLQGFRAPGLGLNQAGLQALKDAGYRYDTSSVDDPMVWPHKLLSGLWEFPLASIKLGSSRTSTITMDYSIYHLKTQAKDTLTRDMSLWDKQRKELLDSYLEYFTTNYTHNRAPVFIGHHFSLWNDGLYWQVMQDFAKVVCGKPEVLCATYSDLADYLDSKK